MTNITIQSKSLFATAAILLDKSTTMATKPSKPLYFEITILTGGISQLGWAHFVDKSYSVALSSNRDIDDNSKNSLTLFQPNSDTGDGAGDDALSYGYDGFRGLVFHKEEEIPYGRKAEDEDGSNGQPWKEGDVVGCLYDICKGTVQYFLNGEDLGIAFTLKSPIPSTVGTRCNNKQNTFPHLFPVFSMDQDEIISANIGPKFKFTPTSSNKSCDIMGICDLVNTGAVVGRTEECSVEVIKELKTTSTIRQGQQSELISSPDVPTGVPSNCSVVGASLDMKVPPLHTINEEPSSSYKASVLNKKSTPKGSTPKKQDSKKNNETKEVNLEDIQSVEELKELGMDRLKEGLFALGCKCGGTLEERAERLFLIKGMGKKDYPMKVRGKNFVL